MIELIPATESAAVLVDHLLWQRKSEHTSSKGSVLYLNGGSLRQQSIAFDGARVALGQCRRRRRLWLRRLQCYNVTNHQ